jgi:hypothetical protein
MTAVRSPGRGRMLSRIFNSTSAWGPMLFKTSICPLAWAVLAFRVFHDMSTYFSNSVIIAFVVLQTWTRRVRLLFMLPVRARGLMMPVVLIR